MTVIVGIRCQDGVVLGADSAATYSPPFGGINQATIKQQTSKKLEIIGDHVVLGVSGTVGLGQSYQAEIASVIGKNQGRVKWKTVSEAKKALTKAIWAHAEPAWQRAQVVAQTVGAPTALQECATHSVVAFPVKDDPCLLQFTPQCDSEEATEQLPFVSVGSGQPVADPFLAFLRRIFWPNGMPNLNEGILAALWTVSHTIQSQPGLVGEPVRVVTLNRDNQGQWKAQELSRTDLDEHRQMIESMEEDMRTTTRGSFTTKPTTPIPEEPTE